MDEFPLDLPVLRKYYFHPQKDELMNPFWVNSENERLACHYHKKHPGAKTIIHFHGNGETVGEFIPYFIPLIDEMGFNCFFAEYRGYGMSAGTPGFLRLLKDAEAIINSIDVPPEKLILYGRSLGTLCALHGAYLFPDTAGLILESGIADLAEWNIFEYAMEELDSGLKNVDKNKIQKIFQQSIEIT